jgi:hypothetical protein
MQHATVCSAPWRGHEPWLFGRVGVALLLFKLNFIAPWQQHSVTSFVLHSLYSNKYTTCRFLFVLFVNLYFCLYIVIGCIS